MVQPPRLTTLRTILSEWTQPRLSPLAFIQFPPWFSIQFPLSSHSLWWILFILYCILFILYIVVSLILSMSEYFHYCISEPGYIFDVFWSWKLVTHIEHIYCESSINIIQLRTCAYFCHSIRFRRPITTIVRSGIYKTNFLIGVRRVRRYFFACLSLLLNSIILCSNSIDRTAVSATMEWELGVGRNRSSWPRNNTAGHPQAQLLYSLYKDPPVEDLLKHLKFLHVKGTQSVFAWILVDSIIDTSIHRWAPMAKKHQLDLYW